MESLEFGDKGLWADIWSACTGAEDLRTPPSKLLGNFLDVGTPDKFPKPCSKVQLMAAKKLEQKLETSAKVLKPLSNDQDGEGRHPKDAPPPRKAKKPKTKGKTKSERKPPNGPMTAPKREFIKSMQDTGHSYKEALALWATSAEREAILATMSTSERKRRRF